MIKKILAILAAIGGVLSSIFFVLFKQAKEERKAEEERAERAEVALNAQVNAQKKEAEVKKENEKKREDIKGNTLNNFNASSSILYND